MMHTTKCYLICISHISEAGHGVGQSIHLARIWEAHNLTSAVAAAAAAAAVAMATSPRAYVNPL